MKEAVKFLVTIFRDSNQDLANIFCAEADNDKERILDYLQATKEYTEGLIEKLKNYE